MIWGFTGTRHNLTDPQIGWLYSILEDSRPKQVHHGACTGADLAVHQACLDIEIPVVVWPPIKLDWVAPQCLAPHHLVAIMPAMHYLPRDREICRAADVLKALPKQEQQPDPMQWGGTWYTVDFATRIYKPVDICYPSGRIENRRST